MSHRPSSQETHGQHLDEALRVSALNRREQVIRDLEAENRRLVEALRDLVESCVDWSNDDIRDHARAALSGEGKAA